MTSSEPREWKRIESDIFLLFRFEEESLGVDKFQNEDTEDIFRFNL